MFRSRTIHRVTIYHITTVTICITIHNYIYCIAICFVLCQLGSILSRPQWVEQVLSLRCYSQNFENEGVLEGVGILILPTHLWRWYWHSMFTEIEYHNVRCKQTRAGVIICVVSCIISDVEYTSIFCFTKCLPDILSSQIRSILSRKKENPGLILGLRPANERRRYKVTPSLMGWAQTKNQPWKSECYHLLPTYSLYHGTSDKCLVRLHSFKIGQFVTGLGCFG